MKEEGKKRSASRGKGKKSMKPNKDLEEEEDARNYTNINLVDSSLEISAFTSVNAPQQRLSYTKNMGNWQGI